MAFRIYNTTIDGKKERLVRMKDIADEMANMEEQVISEGKRLDREIPEMWKALKISLLDFDINYKDYDKLNHQE